MNADNEIRASEQASRAFAVSVFSKLGVPEEEAGTWADVMVEASVRGVDSHGILVLPMYAAMLEAGGIRLHASLEIVADHGPMLLLDGGHGIGPVIATRAMDLALEPANLV